MRLRHDRPRHREAVEKMRKQGVKAIAYSGRRHESRRRQPMRGYAHLPLSTGTNNTFPEREATIAGLATGLVSTGLVTNGVLRRRRFCAA